MKRSEINIYSELFGPFPRKIIFLICNSTLPPWWGYNDEYQRVRCGGISGGIRVELHEVPPIFHP